MCKEYKIKYDSEVTLLTCCTQTVAIVGSLEKQDLRYPKISSTHWKKKSIKNVFTGLPNILSSSILLINFLPCQCHLVWPAPAAETEHLKWHAGNFQTSPGYCGGPRWPKRQTNLTPQPSPTQNFCYGMDVYSDLVVGMCCFQHIIELEVWWQVVETTKSGGFVDSCRPCTVSWPTCSHKENKNPLSIYTI